ncbi:MAG: hypothetical protein QF828_13825 [Pseudomonadales bacterium]|nr:hypothetical protein [Pseudomonadales bacterium]
MNHHIDQSIPQFFQFLQLPIVLFQLDMKVVNLEMVFNSSDDLFGVERFGYVVYSARIESLNFVEGVS